MRYFNTRERKERKKKREAGCVPGGSSAVSGQLAPLMTARLPLPTPLRAPLPLAALPAGATRPYRSPPLPPGSARVLTGAQHSPSAGAVPSRCAGRIPTAALPRSSGRCPAVHGATALQKPFLLLLLLRFPPASPCAGGLPRLSRAAADPRAAGGPGRSLSAPGIHRSASFELQLLCGNLHPGRGKKKARKGQAAASGPALVG